MAWTDLTEVTGRPRLTTQLVNNIIGNINYVADRPLILNKLTVTGSALTYTNAGGETTLPTGLGGSITPTVSRSGFSDQSILLVQFIMQMQASAAGVNFTIRLKRGGSTVETFLDRLDSTTSIHKTYATYLQVATNVATVLTTTIQVTTASQSITLPLNATEIFTTYEI